MLTQPMTPGTPPRTWQRKCARCVPDLVTCRTRPGVRNVGQSCQRENTFLLVREKLRARPSETEIYDLKHYKNNHGDCQPSSRCKTDVNYEPSKTIVSDGHDHLLLRKVLERTLIYKSPGDFVHCMGTYLVVCFNNSMLQYHDKQLGSHFGEKLYKFLTYLSVLAWNDHVNNRRATSTKHQSDPRNPRRQSVIRRLEDRKYCFGGTVWQEYTTIYLR